MTPMTPIDRFAWALSIGAGLIVGAAGIARAEHHTGAVEPENAHRNIVLDYEKFVERDWFDEADRNDDGVLSYDEAADAPAALRHAGTLELAKFRRADVNHDGAIDLDEARGELAWEIANHDHLEQAFAEHPGLAETVARYPSAAERLAEHPDILEFLSHHPGALDQLAQHPEALRRLRARADVEQQLPQYPAVARRLHEAERSRGIARPWSTFQTHPARVQAMQQSAAGD